MPEGKSNGLHLCPLTEESVERMNGIAIGNDRIERLLERLIDTTREGHFLVASEVKEMRSDLIAPATNKNSVPFPIAKWIVLSLLLSHLLVIIWFTGISPYLNGRTIEFHKLNDIPKSNIRSESEVSN